MMDSQHRSRKAPGNPHCWNGSRDFPSSHGTLISVSWDLLENPRPLRPPWFIGTCYDGCGTPLEIRFSRLMILFLRKESVEEKAKPGAFGCRKICTSFLRGPSDVAKLVPPFSIRQASRRENSWAVPPRLELSMFHQYILKTGSMINMII